MRSIGFSLGAFLKITIIAIVGILLAKFVFKKVNVPGLSSAVDAV
jgi:hypothetical protein